MQKRGISRLLRENVWLCGVALGLTACSPTSEKPAPQVEQAIIVDHTSMLPLEGRTGTHVAPHILDQPNFPGGTVGDYDVKGQKYQLFIADLKADQDAAFLLMDVKKTLHDPEYISYMGGYFGGKVYVFSKLHYLAGVVGLPREQADPIARVLAAHLK
jgi:hypothetical protein